MSILQSIQTALGDAGITVGEGAYPDAPEPCGKVIFTGEEKSVSYMDGKTISSETFKIVVRGTNYRALEEKTDLIITSLKKAGFIPLGGYEDVEPEAGDTFMQLAVRFKTIKVIN